MKYTIEIHYPRKLEELSTSKYDGPIQIEFKGEEYKFQTVVDEKSTIFLISGNTKHTPREFNDTIKSRVAQRAIELINRSINRIRTFYHQNAGYQLVSPRIVTQIIFEYENDSQVIREIMALNQEMPEFVKEFYDYLNEEEFALSLSEKLEIDQLIFLHLIIDGYYSLYEGKYNECIINCATATESMIFPEIKEWIKSKLFHKNEKSAERILMEIPMSLKYELLFGTVKYEFLNRQEKLLEKMKRINKLRNSIIHSGHQSTKEEAEMTLNYSAKLIYIVYFNIENFEE